MMRKISIKYLTLCIITFFYQNTFGQLNLVPSEYISNYDLKGNVKSVIEDESEEIYISNDQKKLIRNVRTYTFNRKGFLLDYYLKNNDGFEYLNEKNEYDENNNITYKLDQRRKDILINGKRKRTNDLLKFETKNTYNNYGKLLISEQKATGDDDFYVVEKNIYTDSLLIESLGINDNIPFQYSDRFFRNTLTKYTYDSRGLLINRKEYHDKESMYYVADSSGANIIKPISIKDVIYDRFNLRTETFYIYNNKKQQVSLKSITHDKDYDYGLGAEIQTEYFGTNKRKETFVEEKHNSGYFYDYKIIEDDTLVTAKWWFSKFKGDSIQKKRKGFQIKYNNDGSYTKFIYNSDEELDKRIAYDKSGKVIDQFPKSESKFKSSKKYDKFGNLIFSEKRHKSNNKLVYRLTRKIEYYQ